LLKPRGLGPCKHISFWVTDEGDPIFFRRTFLLGAGIGTYQRNCMPVCAYDLNSDEVQVGILPVSNTSFIALKRLHTESPFGQFDMVMRSVVRHGYATYSFIAASRSRLLNGSNVGNIQAALDALAARIALGDFVG